MGLSCLKLWQLLISWGGINNLCALLVWIIRMWLPCLRVHLITAILMSYGNPIWVINIIIGAVIDMEMWRDAIGFEGYYEVSNFGNIRRTGKVKNLAKTLNKEGYVQYCFCVKSKRKNILGLQVVAQAWLGPAPSPKHMPLHSNGIRDDNNVSNLRWGTNQENSDDMVRHGTQCKGMDSHLSKLTEQDVRDIRASTLSQSALAKRYGVSQGNIYQIIHHITWKHI